MISAIIMHYGLVEVALISPNVAFFLYLDKYL